MTSSMFLLQLKDLRTNQNSRIIRNFRDSLDVELAGKFDRLQNAILCTQISLQYWQTVSDVGDSTLMTHTWDVFDSLFGCSVSIQAPVAQRMAKGYLPDKSLHSG